MSDNEPVDVGQAAIVAVRADPRSEQAWRDFYDYFRRQVAAALIFAGARADVEDLTQDVFRRFLEKCPWRTDWRTLPDRPVVLKYLRTTATRLVTDQYQLNIRRRHEEPGQELDEFPSRAGLEDTAGSLDELLRVLDSRDRTLLRLLLQGASLDEIAFELDTTYQNAAVKVHRLKARVKKWRAAGL
jgi:RNA polymerase sigma factor (sigma-70 family)